MRVLSGRRVCAILAENGFLGCGNAAAMWMQKRSEGSTITVPVPNHAELKTGTLMSIIRQSGLPRSLFEME